MSYQTNRVRAAVDRTNLYDDITNGTRAASSRPGGRFQALCLAAAAGTRPGDKRPAIRQLGCCET